ncbi:MAG: DinB family protein [Haliscomenobacteraceae bacterium CHB4]|nr:DinB family protein [Haliscomenobacteraceae bacterium CHB4]
MTQYCKQNLFELKELLQNLSEEQYSRPSDILSGASIGQHFRHILEFYYCLIEALDTGIVNYDNRKRNKQIETNPSAAKTAIDNIISVLDSGMECTDLTLQGSFGVMGDQVVSIRSSVYRELAYNLEHSIHHQALIKVGLKEQGMECLIGPGFGVAPATVRFKQLVQ